MDAMIVFDRVVWYNGRYEQAHALKIDYYGDEWLLLTLAKENRFAWVKLTDTQPQRMPHESQQDQ